MTAQRIETRTAGEQFDLACDSFHARRIGDAQWLFDEAERLGWNPDECAGARWMCWMLQGRFEQAWLESDAIARRGAFDANRFWDGGPFDGKRVILRCLHGLGDAIQFIRYAPLLRERASYLIVEAHPELVTVLRGVKQIDEVITWGEHAPATPPHWDRQIEIMELPRAFRTTIHSIPDFIPYIDVEPERVARSRNNLGEAPSPKIGILWTASGWDPARSLPFSELEPLLNLPQFTFYSLQRGPERKHLATARVHDTALHSPDIADTAADILNLDLVITVDTMVAHLAGALGKRVWTLLPWEADWRWMLERDDTPWYPTMRLFRQRSRGDWGGVVEAVARELAGPAIL